MTDIERDQLYLAKRTARMDLRVSPELIAILDEQIEQLRARGNKRVTRTDLITMAIGYYIQSQGG